jgi:hypothetical protein
MSQNKKKTNINALCNFTTIFKKNDSYHTLDFYCKTLNQAEEATGLSYRGIYWLKLQRKLMA